ncbi:AAA family ATPase [Massilia atriviolacea]|uniref:GAF domain-containing protein n=1 Tax=Massilia atriviolacea TaxID=2495579 RepID=A0A430HN88_9BURK|nr:AAA family ATPase [Massilia atriviolacea]RSZ58973.1 GAF domain-containing protein [Massilia atriviolacea]
MDSEPQRLIGRAADLEALRAAFAAACRRKEGALLLKGAAGAGKSALLAQLAPIAASHGGWYVSGKCDQYRHDAPSAIVQAMRALGRLLLKEPAAPLAQQRERILAALDTNAGLVAAALPEFALLLGRIDAADSDPARHQARMRNAFLDLLRAVVSPARPLVIAIDDLQWAGPAALAAFDALLRDATLHGLFLAGAFRDDIDSAHPLHAMLPRWRACPTLEINNLAQDAMPALIGQRLGLAPERCTALAAIIGARTHGNPFDTIELLDALRQQGLCDAPDPARIDAFIAQRDVSSLLALRIARLPPAPRLMLQVLACLGGAVDAQVLALAAGIDTAALEPALADALVLEAQRGLRFCHDRVQQAVYEGMPAHERQALHLAIGRRLLAHAGQEAGASEQYLAFGGSALALDERLQVAALFGQAAAQARNQADYALEERFLAAAVRLHGAAPGPMRAWHACLYSLGRHADADAVYARIADGATTLTELIEATSVQIDSLTSRRLLPEAIDLGTALLARAGIVLREAEADGELDAITAWAHSGALDADLLRPAPTDPHVLALGTLLHLTTLASYYADDRRLLRLLVRYQRMWIEHGPCAALLKTFGTLPILFKRRGDYRTGHALLIKAQAIGKARGYDYEAAWLQHVFALASLHWVEPLENAIAHARQARQVLLQNGDVQYATHSYHTEIVAQLDCAPTLDMLAAILSEAEASTGRGGNVTASRVHRSYRYLLDVLRGAIDLRFPAPPGDLDTLTACLVRAHMALLFGDDEALARHSAAAMPLLASFAGIYPAALGYLFRALALARQPHPGGGALRELHACRQWMALRAADAPRNFAHMVTWIDAECAWASGDAATAARLFDHALLAMRTHRRPWQRAAITERAGLCYLAQGLQYVGTALLAEALRHYDAWGATAKAHAMRQAHAFLRRATDAAGAPADKVDLLAVLRASQALSAETTLARLEERVCEQLRALAGATAVKLIGPGAGSPALPLSLLRHVERARAVLLLDDALQDDRFARDPYFAGYGQCAVLAVPIFAQHALHAVLLLENSAMRGAFGAARLDTAMLIAGQLTISLVNLGHRAPPDGAPDSAPATH